MSADDTLPFQCDAWSRRVYKCTSQCDGCFRREHARAAEHVEQLRAALAGANARIDQLLKPVSEKEAIVMFELFQKYGRHSASCEENGHRVYKGADCVECSCGFAQAVAALPSEEPHG
jgi:hypothetical protein